MELMIISPYCTTVPFIADCKKFSLENLRKNLIKASLIESQLKQPSLLLW